MAVITGKRGARVFASNSPRLLEAIGRARGPEGRFSLAGVERCAQRFAGRPGAGLFGMTDQGPQYDPDMLDKAKAEEKAFIEKMGVYDIVPRSEAAKKGCRVIGTR